MKFAVQTFGCKVNSYESAAMEKVLAEHGFEPVSGCDDADVVIVNSCTVTENGDRKVRKFLRHVKRENPGAITVLTGCMPQAYPEAAAKIAEADIVTGTGSRLDIAALIKNYMAGTQKKVAISDNTAQYFEMLDPTRITGHTRAFLKIEDGCDRYCSYCIVPFARGQVRSMPLDDIETAAKKFAANGYRELVLTGINLSFYGRDLGAGLADAVERVSRAHDIERIRLSSLESDLLSEQTLVRLSKVSKLCPHFHLSLQSGCAATLKRMSRHYDAAQFLKLTARIKELFDNPTFTTDVIVGFPGETHDEFETSVQFVKSCRFLKVHVFPYSARPGTAAARFPDQIDRKTKNKRVREMTKAADQSRELVMRSFVGTMDSVVLEQPGGDGFEGYTSRYLPVTVRGENLETGMIVAGVIEHDNSGYYIVGSG